MGSQICCILSASDYFRLIFLQKLSQATPYLSRYVATAVRNTPRFNSQEFNMKPSNFYSVRIDSRLRNAAEKVLESEESLSSFVEHSIRYQVQRRNLLRTFVERGLASAAEARHSGEYFSTDEVLTELDQIIDAQQRG